MSNEHIFSILILCVIVAIIAHVYRVAADQLEKEIAIMRERLRRQQDEIDRLLDVQLRFITKRDEELDNLIAAIPQRVDKAISDAVATFVHPYQEFNALMQERSKSFDDPYDIDFRVGQDELDEILAKHEAGVKS